MKVKSGNIILLNGPTSAGKTSLSELIQKIMPSPFMHIGIDKMIYMMPAKINNWEGDYSEQGFWWKEGLDAENKKVHHLQAGTYAQQCMRTLKDIVVTLASNGHNVVIDEVILTKEESALWQKKISQFNHLLVGVTAPLQILEERERARGDRIIGSARAQHKKVHCNMEYDIEVNTHQMTLNECVQKILHNFNKKILH